MATADTIEVQAQMIRYPPGYRMTPHSDGIRRLSVLVAGEQEETRRSRAERAAVGSVALKDPALVHSNRFGARGTTIVSVIIPDEAAAEMGYPVLRLLPWRWRHGAGASTAGLRLASALRRLDGPVVEDCLHELLGGFTARPARPAACAPATLRRILDRLHDEPDPAPSVRRLAAEAGMHPVSLGRAFRRAFGCSITRYRQRLRAASVAERLVAAGESQVEIALEYGFSDQSHMCRVFSRELGLPPGAYRDSLAPSREGLDSFKTEWSVAI